MTIRLSKHPPNTKTMSLGDIGLETRTQEILLAASNHDLATLKPFLRIPGSASVQDPETGFTPLHAAIAACGPASSHRKNAVEDTSTNGVTNGHVNDSEPTGEEEEEEVDIERAKATVKELFLSGAIWNDLDINDETPGCLAWRLGQKELYELVVEAGVRAELLMNLMGGYEQLPDDDDIEEEEEEGDDTNKIVAAEEQTDINPHPEPTTDPPTDVNSEDYLSSTLTFTPDGSKLLDSDANGVMMSWELPIMEKTASLLAPTPGLLILNIGFGLGIIDRLFAATSPATHHIIEAHPGVISKLHHASGETGPDSDPNSNFAYFGPQGPWQSQKEGRNVIHAGKWQDIVPTILQEGQVFDVIYFDTFGEDYSQLKLFFTEYVVGLLSSEGRFSFFNGLGADRRVCYDVYCRVVELDLCDAGLDVEWVDVDVDLGADGEGEAEKGLGKEGEGEWKGVKRRYWTLEKYRLPVCRFMG